jgi:hypothetical protein
MNEREREWQSRMAQVPSGKRGQSTAYTKMPLRRIACRFTEVVDPQYPVQMMTLECGHTTAWRGQKSHMRCPWCSINEFAVSDNDDEATKERSDERDV